MKSLLITCILSAATIVHAEGSGSTVGNGGSAIVCTDANEKILSVRLLDYYEAEVQRGIQINLGGPEVNFNQKVEVALNRLKSIDQSFSRLFNSANQFWNKAKFYSGVRLIEIPDSKNILIPQGCHQEQIAVRTQANVPEDRIFSINHDLWQYLTNDDKAGLILHEMFYYLIDDDRKIYQKPPFEDSRAVRYFVSKISSDEVKSWKLPDYIETLYWLGRSHFEHMGYDFVVSKSVQKPYEDYERDSPTFDGEGRLTGGKIGGKIFQFQGKSFQIDAVVLYPDHNYEITEFEPSYPAYLKTTSHQMLWFKDHVKIKNGLVYSGYVLKEERLKFKKDGVYDLTMNFPEDSEGLNFVAFDEQGTLLQCYSCVGTYQIFGKKLSLTMPNMKIENHWPSYRRIYSEKIFDGIEIGLYLDRSASAKVLGKTVAVSGNFVCDSFGVRMINLVKPTALPLGNLSILFEGLVDINGSYIKSAQLAENTILKSVDGNEIQYLKGMTLSFNEKGEVTHMTQQGGRYGF